MRVLVTGAAGFIGNAVALRLLERGDQVAGLDNLNAYYDINLKKSRLERISNHPGYTNVAASLEDREAVDQLFREFRPQRVVHLAAQAGVRYSVDNPRAYVDSNVVGFLNILEGCRHEEVEHLVYASSSSVYGANTRMPYSVHDPVDHPISLYAATKKANEMMAHAYSHLYRIPTTGLRFFTVYGPWNRPDMAVFLFARAILAGEPIYLFNHGEMQRDFTYIDDAVDGVIGALDKPAKPDPEWNGERLEPAASSAPYRLYNIGNHKPVTLRQLIEVLEQALGKSAVKVMRPMQPGDVPATFADIDESQRNLGFEPATSIEEGLRRFVTWYRDYYNV